MLSLAHLPGVMLMGLLISDMTSVRNEMGVEDKGGYGGFKSINYGLGRVRH